MGGRRDDPRNGKMAAYMNTPFHSGFVAILGRPNVGKSTLVNRLVGHKVSIVTARPQTTRTRVLGIINRPDAQMVLIDTPGVHKDGSALGRQMSSEIAQALEGIDLLAVIIDAPRRMTAADRLVIERASRFSGPKILILNKIDCISKTALLPLLEACAKEAEFAEMIPISALTGDGVDLVLKRFLSYLPEGAAHFPEDQYTDQPERFLAAEIVREKVMAATRQEVPHAVAVHVDSYEDKNTLIRIAAEVQVERESQKGIVIGRGGAHLKEIGTNARKELEVLLGAKVYLELRVTVAPDWREDPQHVRQVDWRRDLEEMSGWSEPVE
jgi:GTP-binding protein Era